jgi:chaperone LolA
MIEYKNTRFRLVSVIFFIVFIPSGFAMPSLNQPLDSLKNYQADFKQTTMANGQVTANATGKVCIHRPWQMRWQVITPDAQTLLVNHRTLVQINPDLNQATVRQMNPTELSNAGLLLASNADLSHLFIIKNLEDKNGVSSFRLTPKKPLEITEIILNFNTSGLSSMQTWNTLGQHNIFEFSKIDTHSMIPTSLFIFKPSKDMDVLKASD